MPLISFLVTDGLLNLAFKFATFSSLVANISIELIFSSATVEANSVDTVSGFWSSKRGAPFGFAFWVDVAVISCTVPFGSALGGGGLGKDGGSCCLGFAFCVAVAMISCSVNFGTALGGGAINGWADG